jgi:hypothetical protein
MTTTASIDRVRRWLPGLALVAALLLPAAPAVAAEGFGYERFDATTLDEAGQADTRAGAHPYGVTSLTGFNLQAPNSPLEKPKDLTVVLPPGLVGDPTAVPQCPAELFAEAFSVCPVSSQIGLVAHDAPGQPGTFGVYNLSPQKGTAAQFGLKVNGIPVVLTARVRPTDYRISMTVENILSAYSPSFTDVMFWGVPADPRHDTFRVASPDELCGGNLVNPFAGSGCYSATSPGVPPAPFISTPTDCSAGPLTTTISGVSWEDATDVATASAVSHNGATPPTPIGVTGCDQVPFEPMIVARPTTNVADSPSGLEVNVHVPQGVDPEGRATAHLKKAVVQLPKGVTVNAASAAGLAACSPGQIGLITAAGNPAARFDGAPAACPQGSRIGTVEVGTPVVDHPLPGSVYLAEQGNNPFNSLLALYMAVEDPQTGVTIKLAGKAEADSRTGQLTTTFDENPQLPFEDQGQPLRRPAGAASDRGQLRHLHHHLGPDSVDDARRL